MAIRNSWTSGSLRFALSLAVVGVAGGAVAQLNIRSMPMEFIQMNTKHAPGAPVEVVPVGQINTYSFWPQIDSSIGQRGIMPRPGTPGHRLPLGTRNRSIAGGVRGGTRASTGTNFPGQEFNGWLPPDPHMAAGPDHIVQVVNSQIAFFEKATENKLFQQSGNQFFSGIGALPDPFDPRVIYDQSNDRWIILFLTVGASEAQILLAVSDDSNPMGTWNRFILNSAVSIGGNLSWLDYPMVGYTADALVVSGNMFGFTTGFNGCLAFVIRTAGLYNNTGVVSTPFTVTTDFNIQPGDSYTVGQTTVFGISLDTFSSVRVYAFSAVDTATPTLTSTVMAVQPFVDIGSAPSGGGLGLDTISGRTMDAAERDGFFVAAHTIALPSDNRSSVRWYEIDMGSWPTSGLPAMAQQGNITLGAGEWALMPAISKNVFGDISVIYSRSSSSIFSDLVVSSRMASDPPGTIGSPTLLQVGLSTNQGGSRHRWGDYFAVVPDPNDDATFWGNGEVTRADGRWTTEIQSWAVTGGGGTGVDYDPNNLSTFLGTFSGGALANVLTSDNGFHDVDSVLLAGQGHFAAIQADFTIAEASANVSQLLFTVEANVDPGVTATGTVFLFNWNSGLFEYGKAFDVQKFGNDLQGVKIKTNPGKYVSGTGQVRMVFRSHDSFRRRGTTSSPFRMRTDYVHLNVKT